MAFDTITPFHTYIWKVASRCNINCSYCYVYNLEDQRWRRQPKLMSKEVAHRAAMRIRGHCEAHGKREAAIVFHGGEPLLGGVRHLEMLTTTISEVFAGSGIDLKVGMQSNGLLFTPQIGDLLVQRGVSIGVSIDGPPHINDRARVDHRNRPTSATLERKLAVLNRPKYRPIFSGFLCVIDISSDPVEVIDYLGGFSPPNIDFLFPLNNYDSPPPGKEIDLKATPYGDWLISAFDRYWNGSGSGSVRIFDSLLRLIFGAPSLVESLGLNPVDLVVIETNGEIEAVDALKSTYDGATVLGYNVFDHDFDVVASNFAIRQRQIGADGLCHECKRCPVVDICGGGYIAHRFSAADGFLRPSIYGPDIEKLIRHIQLKAADQFAGHAGILSVADEHPPC
jgi:uncharacterized protein